MHLFNQIIRNNMRINFCCPDILMPEHFLHCPQIGIMIQQMRGKRMAQHMRRNFIPVKAASIASSLRCLKKLSRVTWPEAELLEGNSQTERRPPFKNNRGKSDNPAPPPKPARQPGSDVLYCPFPRINSCFLSKLILFSGMETSSETRRPQAYINSSITAIRRCAGSCFRAAASINCRISCSLKNFGSGFCCLGD